MRSNNYLKAISSQQFLVLSALLFLLVNASITHRTFSPRISGTAISAILFSSSTGYYNYRQTANVLKIYEILKQNNLNDEDILLAIPENSGCCEKNPLLGTVSFIDSNYDNMNKNLEIDRQYSTLTLKGVTDMLRGKYPRYLPNKLRNKKSKRLFVYVTGHGGDYYFKIREREAILDEHYRLIFQQLEHRNQYQQIMLFADSCSSSTPFQTIFSRNFIGLASSSFDQKSLSHGHDPILNNAKSDDFTFYLSQYLKENSLVYKKTTINELKNFMDYQKLRVNSKIVAPHLPSTQNINIFMRKQKTVVKRKFLLSN